MHNRLVMDRIESGKELEKVVGHVGNGKLAKVFSKVVVLVVWQNGNDLIIMSYCIDQKRHIGCLTKVI